VPLSRMSDASLRSAYAVWALGYDSLFGAATDRARRRSIALLAPRAGERVLLVGVGTGLDLPHLPRHAAVRAVDLTAAMLRRARRRARRLALPVALAQASAAALPFADGGCDAVLLHLILAVVPDPAAALREVARVLRPGGRAVIWDKILPDGRRPSLLRRAAHVLTHRHLTGFLFDLSAALQAAPTLRVTHREPSLFRGMWQIVVLEKAEGRGQKAEGRTAPL
jgi:phosphatidylethanolamine/phosphatidyl-N-methylethanolamine N-methyltransferase